MFEGVDCVGKSTQIELLKEEFSKDKFKNVLFTSEPGATELGRHLRELLLNKPCAFSKKSELLLFLADRSEHYEQVLSKNKNKLIISDRSFISGLAYAKGFDRNFLFGLNSFVLECFFPQKIIFLKGTKELLKERLTQKSLDSIEKRGLEYFIQIQNEIEEILSFLKEEKKIKTQILTLDAAESRENLHGKIKEFIDD